MGQVNQLCLVISVSFLTCALSIFYQVSVYHDSSTARFICKGAVGLLCLIIGVCAYDMSCCRVSRRHSLGSAICLYVFYKLIKPIGWVLRRKLEKDTKSCRQTQESLLKDIIKLNANTEYGLANNFAGIKSREDFVQTHPLSHYDRYEDYIERMTDGEKNVLSAETLEMIALSSGTTGKSKKLPVTSWNRHLPLYLGILPLSLLIKTWPKAGEINQMFRLWSRPMEWIYSKAGILMGSVSTTPKRLKMLNFLYTDPDPVTDVKGESETRYLQLLFALSDKNLGVIVSTLASMIYYAFQVLESEWHQLADDIEHGTIKRELNIDVDIRKRLEKLLPPNKARAQQIRRECSEGFHGIAKRLWPSLQVLYCVTTGSQNVYYRQMKELECIDLTFYSAGYIASEGLLGLDLFPERDSEITKYVLLPSSLFYEFIRIEDSHMDQPSTLFAEQVEVGHEYELAVTTGNGLYRFRFGDVVTIQGFHNEAPLFTFSYRIGQFLNVHVEKTTEATFYKALLKAELRWRRHSLIEYCCCESTMLRHNPDFNQTPPYYVVFLELQQTENVKMSESQKNYIDEDLRAESSIYDSFRHKGSIGPIRALVVRPGAFRDLKHHVVTTFGTSAQQYKVPRVLRKVDLVNFMLHYVDE